MNARQLVTDTVRHGYRNLVGTIVVSVLVSLSVVPLAAMATVGTPSAVLAGLWATCLLLGIVLVGGFRFATTVADRGVPVPVLSDLRASIATPRTGLALGALTFLVVVAAAGLVTLAPPRFAPYALGVAAFLLVDWFLVVSFAAPEFSKTLPLRSALRASVGRLLVAPSAVALYLLLSVTCFLIAGVTVITVGVFLPGALCLLAAHTTTTVDAERTN